MVGAGARGAKQSSRSLIGQSSVIDVTGDSFQRDEKCLGDSARPVRMREAGRQGLRKIVMQRL